MLSLASPLSLILPWPSGHDVCRLCLDCDVYMRYLPGSWNDSITQGGNRSAQLASVHGYLDTFTSVYWSGQRRELLRAKGHSYKLGSH